MRKLLCVILCLVLCFILYAQPVTAIAVVDDLAAAAIAVLAACGLSFVFSGLSASGALDKVSGLLSDYAQSIGETVPAWLAAYEMTMFGGKLRLAAGLATKIYGFADWLRNSYDIQNDSDVDIETVIGGNGFLLNDGNIFPVYNASSSSFYTDSLYDGMVPRDAGPITFIFANGSRIVYDSNGLLSIYRPDNSVVVSKNLIQTHKTVYMGFILGKRKDNHTYLFSILGPYSAGYLNIGETGDVLDFLGEVIYQESSSIGIDSGVISIPVNAAVDDVLVDVGAIPVGTTVSGVTDIIIDNALAGTLDASIEETADLPPVVPPEAVGDYTIDLTSFFPFCIPFDVYDAITLFSADPVAPNMPLYMTWRGTQYGFDIDLSSFDSLAAILRRMEIILFIVGLAAVTRRYIKW